MEDELRKRQEANNKKYEEEGLTDEVFEEQLKINKLRYDKKISDKSEFVDGYLQ